MTEDMPGRIWAIETAAIDDTGRKMIASRIQAAKSMTPYVRADLADAMVKAAEDAQRAFEAMLAPVGSVPNSAVSPQFMRDKIAAALSAYKEIQKDG